MADKETYYHSKKTYYHSKENYDDWWNANKECLVSPHLDHSFLLSFVGVRVRQTKRATWVTSSSSSPLKSVQVLSRVCAGVLSALTHFLLPPLLCLPCFAFLSLSFAHLCLRSCVCARAAQVDTCMYASAGHVKTRSCVCNAGNRAPGMPGNPSPCASDMHDLHWQESRRSASCWWASVKAAVRYHVRKSD